MITRRLYPADVSEEAWNFAVPYLTPMVGDLRSIMRVPQGRQARPVL